MSTDSEERIVLMEMHAAKVAEIADLQATCAKLEARATAAEQERDKQNAQWVEANGRAARRLDTINELQAELEAAEARVTALAQREAETDGRIADLERDLAETAKLALGRQAALALLLDQRIAALASPSTPSTSCNGCGRSPESCRCEPSTPSPDACAPGAEGEPYVDGR